MAAVSCQKTSRIIHETRLPQRQGRPAGAGWSLHRECAATQQMPPQVIFPPL
jgi:hypothetical protein